MLWEGTGEHGESVVQTLDLETGRTEVFARLPQEDFGEGITLLDGKLYQLTWQSNKAYVYDLKTGKKIKEFRYPGEGWGLTTDGQKLYMSDGTANIYTLDPATFKREKRTTVTLKGMAINFLNELEWIDGKLWANVYTTDQIVIIDPGDRRGRRGRRPHGTVARRGGYAHDRRTERHRIRCRREAHLRDRQELEQTLRNRNHRKVNGKQSYTRRSNPASCCSTAASAPWSQQYGFTEEDYRGERFRDWNVLLKGCNDLLAVTRPGAVREIHVKYLQAGADIIETDSFNANAVSLADYGLEAYAYEISRAAAGVARSAADEFTARNPLKPRFVAGSMGPTNRTASMSADVGNPAAREVTFTQLAEAYTDQARGLVDGGADILLVETVFDTLNAKAALYAIDTLGRDSSDAQSPSWSRARWPTPAAAPSRDRPSRLSTPRYRMRGSSPSASTAPMAPGS